MYRLLAVFSAVVTVASHAGAQQYQRRATMVGGGGGGQGKCTIEVVVDGAADIEIRGDQGTIRNISGRPAEWRRFECSGPLPANPGDFRFAGVDGRGRQQLLRDPRNGGAAVVHIEDPDGGSEGYTFDLTWGGGGGSGESVGRAIGGVIGGILNAERHFTTDQAVNECQNAVRSQAGDRFGGRAIEFLNTRIDDSPGRNDWVVGTIDVHRGPNEQERFRFSCSVNFDSGHLRSVQIDPMVEPRIEPRVNRDRDSGADRASRFTTDQAINVCQDSVRRQALNRFRGRRIELLNSRIDDNPDRNDWIIGTVEVIRGRDVSEGRYKFSCSVNFDSGQVRSVEIDPRKQQPDWR